MVGLSGEPYPIDAFTMLNQRRRIAGSMIGGMKQTQEMLDFAGKHNIVSDVEIINASEINKAYDRVVASDVKYRCSVHQSSAAKGEECMEGLGLLIDKWVGG